MQLSNKHIIAFDLKNRKLFNNMRNFEIKTDINGTEIYSLNGSFYTMNILISYITT